jgi:hypothetical protein
LTHLVDQDKRVSSLGFLRSMHRLARHGTHLPEDEERRIFSRPHVSLQLGHVGQTAHGEPEVGSEEKMGQEDDGRIR